MSFSKGQTVYLCSASGPVRAKYIGRVGANCAINVDGAQMPVKCSRLRGTPGECALDTGSLRVGQRVALRIVDTSMGPRVWPAKVRRTFANGRVAVQLDGLSHPQFVDRDWLVTL